MFAASVRMPYPSIVTCWVVLDFLSHRVTLGWQEITASGVPRSGDGCRSLAAWGNESIPRRERLCGAGRDEWMADVLDSCTEPTIGLLVDRVRRGTFAFGDAPFIGSRPALRTTHVIRGRRVRRHKANAVKATTTTTIAMMMPVDVPPLVSEPPEPGS
jgi:hypothetical protein